MYLSKFLFIDVSFPTLDKDTVNPASIIRTWRPEAMITYVDLWDDAERRQTSETRGWDISHQKCHLINPDVLTFWSVSRTPYSRELIDYTPDQIKGSERNEEIHIETFTNFLTHGHCNDHRFKLTLQ